MAIKTLLRRNIVWAVVLVGLLFCNFTRVNTTELSTQDLSIRRRAWIGVRIPGIRLIPVSSTTEQTQLASYLRETMPPQFFSGASEFVVANEYWNTGRPQKGEAHSVRRYLYVNNGKSFWVEWSDKIAPTEAQIFWIALLKSLRRGDFVAAETLLYEANYEANAKANAKAAI